MNRSTIQIEPRRQQVCEDTDVMISFFFTTLEYYSMDADEHIRILRTHGNGSAVNALVRTLDRSHSLVKNGEAILRGEEGADQA